MVSDYRVRVGLLQHHKYQRLRKKRGARAAEILLRLWDWTSTHRPDGSFDGLSPGDLEACSGLSPGDVGALIEAGFIDSDPMKAHDWLENQPWVAGAPARSERSRHAASMRWACGEHARSNAASNAPLLSSPSHPSPPDPDLTSPPPVLEEQAPEKKTPARVARGATNGNGHHRDGYADYCFERWKELDGGGQKPPWGKAEYVALADARKRIGDEPHARAAWDRYLTDDSAFYAGHSPRKFLSELGRWVAEERAPLPQRTRDNMAAVRAFKRTLGVQ